MCSRFRKRHASACAAVLLLTACAEEAERPLAAATIDNPRLIAGVGVADAAPVAPSDPSLLRVCADPNNLPFSNERGEGLENRLADLVAADLGKRVTYTWWAQRRGFIRNTLRAGECDVVMGIPYSSEMVLATRPYYRSTYVFATRTDRRLRIASLDDPQLRELTIGVHVIGDDYANAPPAHALGTRGIVNNVRGYTVYGDYAQPNPTSRLVDAVLNREIDVAIVWGPFAGWARSRGAPLDIVPVSPQIDRPFLPMVYDISLGVRRGEDSLRNVLDDLLLRRRSDVDRILAEYGVPIVAGAAVGNVASTAGGP